MSRLRSRLARIKNHQTPLTQGPDSSAREPSIRQRIERIRPSPGIGPGGQRGRMTPQALAEHLGGYCAEEGLIVLERVLVSDSRHGRGRIANGLARALSYFAGDAPCGDEAVVLMDTETTGLAGGAGTLVFLLGLARLTTAGLLIRQYLLTEFRGECALLRRAEAFLGSAEALVTYNGKSFDYPLLQSRYRLARLSDPFADLRHLDLLHLVRCAFARRWPDCRLQTTERRLLGFRRTGDLPGADAPRVWFDWVRRGIARELPRLVQHNYWDLVSLAALPPLLECCYEKPTLSGVDTGAIARRWLRAGEEARAHRYLRAHQGALDEPALLELAWLARRRDDGPLAVKLWLELADKGNPEALERLAKYYEHELRDHDRALHCTRALIQRGKNLDKHRRRERRLLGKICSRG